MTLFSSERAEFCLRLSQRSRNFQGHDERGCHARSHPGQARRDPLSQSAAASPRTPESRTPPAASARSLHLEVQTREGTEASHHLAGFPPRQQEREVTDCKRSSDGTAGMLSCCRSGEGRNVPCSSVAALRTSNFEVRRKSDSARIIARSASLDASVPGSPSSCWSGQPSNGWGCAASGHASSVACNSTTASKTDPSASSGRMISNRRAQQQAGSRARTGAVARAFSPRLQSSHACR